MNKSKFRTELKKIMPGYKWTVHKSSDPEYFLDATGIMTSGLNRTSTLQVIKRKMRATNNFEYEVMSSGFGLKARWLAKAKNNTLATALRDLQDHYVGNANRYIGHANDLKSAREKK